MPTAPRRRLGSAERREQLLDAALEVAAGGDVAAVSVQAIAARAGVSEGLLYHYFPNKQALVAAAVHRAADALVADLAAAGGGDPLSRLRAALVAYLDHVQARPTSWKALLQASSGELAAISQGVEDRSRALILDALGLRQPSPVVVAALAGWASYERAVCVSWLDHPDIERSVVEDLLMSAFLAALEAAGRHDVPAARAFAGLAP